MEQTWRWWGPDDLIALSHVCQAGATGIVTALHDIPAGIAWPAEAVAERKRIIEQDPTLGLRWSVAESVPVHEAIKIGEGDLAPLFDRYRQSLRSLGAAAVGVVSEVSACGRLGGRVSSNFTPSYCPFLGLDQALIAPVKSMISSWMLSGAYRRAQTAAAAQPSEMTTSTISVWVPQTPRKDHSRARTAAAPAPCTSV